MEKVKITQEQADIVEVLKADLDLKHLIYRDRCMDWAHPHFGGLSDKELAIALYVDGGYEVEPDLKEGDVFFHRNSNNIGELKDVFVVWEDGIKSDINYVKELLKSGEVRLATNDEKRLFRQRRWWARHGRGVKQFLEGDLLIDKDHELKEVIKSNNGDLILVSGTRMATYTFTTEQKDKSRIICFAEDRKDI